MSLKKSQDRVQAVFYLYFHASELFFGNIEKTVQGKVHVLKMTKKIQIGVAFLLIVIVIQKGTPVTMTEEINQPLPNAYLAIDQATQESGFTMPSDTLTCSLLRTLAVSKPGGKFLELGTGTGLSTSWILDGMDQRSTLLSIDRDDTLLQIAQTHLGHDERLHLVHTDGEEWVKANLGQKFDYVFADTWHGKYLLLDEVLDMVQRGGLYIVDDMLPQPNWPEGHQEKALRFVEYLESRGDLVVTKQHWATGIIVAVKK